MHTHTHTHTHLSLKLKVRSQTRGPSVRLARGHTTQSSSIGPRDLRAAEFYPPNRVEGEAPRARGVRTPGASCRKQNNAKGDPKGMEVQQNKKKRSHLCIAVTQVTRDDVTEQIREHYPRKSNSRMGLRPEDRRPFFRIPRLVGRRLRRLYFTVFEDNSPAAVDCNGPLCQHICQRSGAESSALGA